MACENQKTNLEFLELLVEMTQVDLEDQHLETLDAFGNWMQVCGGMSASVAGDDEFFFNHQINIFGLAEFLENYNADNLTPDCKNAVNDYLEEFRNSMAVLAFLHGLRRARVEARDRYAKCLHELKGGIT